MRYEPHEYQEYAIKYIIDHPVAAVFLDCGMGKSSITLTAVMDLMFDRFEIGKVLVVGREKRQRVRVSGPTQLGAGGVETRRISSVAYLDARRPDPDALALVLADRPAKGNRDVRRWEVGKTEEGLHRVAIVREVAGGASPQYLMEAIEEVAVRAHRGAMRLSPGGEPAR